jgi:phytoene dehydrogenase-like protein
LATTLIEQHDKVGGMCTGWQRKGYHFEGAVHWLTGSNPNTELNRLWRETGALASDFPVRYDEVFFSVEHDGHIINLYRDIQRTAREMSAFSPADSAALKRLVKEVHTARRIQMPITNIKGLKAANPARPSAGLLLGMLPALPLMARLGKTSTRDYLAAFQHPALRQALTIVPPEYNATSLIFTLATLDGGDGGFPEGGSLGMAGRMQACFEQLGGQLLLKRKVQRVLVQNATATGVQLDGGETLLAAAVVVAQETHAALQQLFDAPPQDAWLEEVCQAKNSACTFISIGVEAEIPATPLWQLDEPLTHAGQKVEELALNSYLDYPGYAPSGCTALTTALMGDTYEFWQQARAEGRYEQEKQRLAEQLSRALCQRFGLSPSQIAVLDIATPLTYERYTGAWHGAWMTPVEPGGKMATYSGECEISGLFFAGHRLMPPGGMPGAVATGRQAAQLVCRHLDAEFV